MSKTRITIQRIQFEHLSKTIKCQIQDISIISGVIHFIPTPIKYQHLLLNTNNCKIITYTTS